MRLSWRRLFPTLLSGEILWTGTLVALDYFVARFIPDIASGLNVLPVFTILLFAFYIAITMTCRAIR